MVGGVDGGDGFKPLLLTALVEGRKEVSRASLLLLPLPMELEEEGNSVAVAVAVGLCAFPS